MNPTEQRTHTTATVALEARIRILEALVDHQVAALLQFLPGTAAELEDVRASIADVRQAVGNERTHRLKMAEEQRNYVDGADRQILAAINEVCGWSWWQRVRWVLTGRR